MSQPIKVVAAVIVKDGTVFAAQRGPGKNMADYWEFPGGKIEADETPEDALAREIEEELGIVVRVGKHLVTTTHAYDFATIELASYFCEIESGELTLTEHTTTAWLSPNELDSVQWAPADVEAVELLKDHAPLLTAI